MNNYNLEIEPLTDEIATIEQIKEFEQKIDAKLPEDYVKFLLQYNGGSPAQDYYDCESRIESETSYIDGVGVSWFYTLAEDYNYNLLKNYNMFFNRMPKEMIPISSSPCGNKICLAVRGSNYGKVYYWDHDWEAEEGEEPTYRNIYLIADSFKKFTDNLYKLELTDTSWISTYRDGTVIITPKDMEPSKRKNN